MNLFLAINSSLTDHFLATHAINRQLTENNRNLQKITEITEINRQFEEINRDLAGNKVRVNSLERAT